MPPRNLTHNWNRHPSDVGGVRPAMTGAFQGTRHIHRIVNAMGAVRVTPGGQAPRVEWFDAIGLSLKDVHGTRNVAVSMLWADGWVEGPIQNPWDAFDSLRSVSTGIRPGELFILGGRTRYEAKIANFGLVYGRGVGQGILQVPDPRTIGRILFQEEMRTLVRIEPPFPTPAFPWRPLTREAQSRWYRASSFWTRLLRDET